MPTTRTLASISHLSRARRPGVPAFCGGLVPALLRCLFLATALGLPVVGTSLASRVHPETAPIGASRSMAEAMR